MRCGQAGAPVIVYYLKKIIFYEILIFFYRIWILTLILFKKKIIMIEIESCFLMYQIFIDLPYVNQFYRAVAQIVMNFDTCLGTISQAHSAVH